MMHFVIIFCPTLLYMTHFAIPDILSDKLLSHYVRTFTAWKVSKYGVFSGPHFPVFGLNSEIYSVNLPTQSEYRKIRTRKNSVFRHFLRSVYDDYFLSDFVISVSFCNKFLYKFLCLSFCELWMYELYLVGAMKWYPTYRWHDHWSRDHWIKIPKLGGNTYQKETGPFLFVTRTYCTNLIEAKTPKLS